MLTQMMSKPPTTKLRAYLDGLPRGGVAELAGRLEIHPVYLLQLAARQNGREPSPQLCVDIERETRGEVSRRDIRPGDWHRIWPELATAAFPAPVQRQAA